MHRLALAVLALALPAAALAHHGWGSYDAQNPVTLTGPIKTMQFTSPHVHADIVADGKEWELTLAPPSRMHARGATDSIVKVGATVTAYGYPSRVKSGEMRAEWIEIAGKRYELR